MEGIVVHGRESPRASSLPVVLNQQKIGLEARTPFHANVRLKKHGSVLEKCLHILVSRQGLVLTAKEYFIAMQALFTFYV